MRPEIETHLGRVRGHVRDGARVFCGIPYATPPVGPLRFKAPRPAIGWRHTPGDASRTYPKLTFDGGVLVSEPRPGVRWASAQIVSPILTLEDRYLTGAEVLGDEDCLYLHVFRPDSAATGLPVFVDVFGGGMVGGSASDGSRWAAEHAMVYVSFDHRTGILGFFQHPELSGRADRRTNDDEQAALDASGNYGLLDLIEALSFIERNAAALGGDPRNITVSGRGSGGFLVNCLLVSPYARRRLSFARVVNQSGPTDMNVGSIAAGRRAGLKTARALCGTGELAAVVEQPAVALISGQRDARRLPRPFAWSDGLVVPARGARPIRFRELFARERDHVNRPMILGASDQESHILYPLICGLAPERLGALLRSFAREHAADAARVLATPRARAFYACATGALNRVSWTMLVKQPLASLAKTSPRAPVYAYEFLWKLAPPPFDRWIGAAHGVSERFFLGEFSDDEYFRVLWTDENAAGRHELSAIIQSYLVNFAHTGDPNEGPHGGLPRWEAAGRDPAVRIQLDATASHARVTALHGARRRTPLTRGDLAAGRPVSPIERVHAAIGTSGRTLEAPRMIHLVVEGHANDRFDRGAWTDALRAATAANPGVRLRFTGRLAGTRLAMGPPPEVRIADAHDWDGSSGSGAAFIEETRFSCREGPTTELLLAHGEPSRIVLNTLHAIMDGGGVLHFLREVFRAHRGEPLVGTTSIARDVDVMRNIEGLPPAYRIAQWANVTGPATGDEPGDVWCRLRLHGPKPNLLYRVALAAASFARAHDDRPIRFSVPVDLRRHVPGLTTTANMTGMVFLDVPRGTTVDDLRRQLRYQLANRSDAFFHPFVHLVHLAPLSTLDQFFGRTRRNLRTRNEKLETGVLSNVGRLASADFSGGGFTAKRMFAIPIPDNFFCVLSALDDTIDITLGLPRIYAGEGRLAALAAHVEAALAER